MRLVDVRVVVLADNIVCVGVVGRRETSLVVVVRVIPRSGVVEIHDVPWPPDLQCRREAAVEGPARRFRDGRSAEEWAEGPGVGVDISAGRIHHGTSHIGVPRAGYPYGVDVAEVLRNRDRFGDLLFDSALPLQRFRISELRVEITRRDVCESSEAPMRISRIECGQICQRSISQVHTCALEGILNRIRIGGCVVQGN